MGVTGSGVDTSSIQKCQNEIDSYNASQNTSQNIYFPTTIQEDVDTHMRNYCQANYGPMSYWSGKPKETCLCQDGYTLLPLNGKTECRTKYQFCKDALPYGHYDKGIDECACDAGYETIDGNCISPDLLDRSCKQSIDENAVFTNMVNGKPVCGCKTGYELTNGRCLLAQTRTAVVAPVIPVIAPVAPKSEQTQPKVKIEVSKPATNNNTDISVSSSTASLEKSSSTNVVATSSKPISKTQKFWGWIKRIFKF
jgi:hypothetical protein